jgi:hypothetical protein
MRSDAAPSDEPPVMDFSVDFDPSEADLEWYVGQAIEAETDHEPSDLDSFLDDLSPSQAASLSDDHTDALAGWEGGAQW